ncbi:hypothetical protein [Enterobacter cloacae]|uniref:hypothetical protein n=1 Tax=Enterobacter cloacae TaxID=550 RepID=UPI002AF8CB8E|nr:hypothetical protein [Enterobacter cloacae]HDC4527426.1 hypothetical protein [Enterobacter cloacae]
MKLNLQSGTTLTAYVFTCGSLYLWGFWLHFDLNILQFVDVTDIVKATILPMITTLCLWAVQSVTNVINNPTSDANRELWKAGGGYRYPIYLQWGFFAFISISALISFTIMFISGTKAEKYLVIGAILLGCLYLWVLIKTNILAEYKSMRAAILISILGMPLIFMNKGVQDAKNNLKGNNTFLVESDNLCGSNLKDEKFRYIGNLSDKGFAYSLKNNSLCIFKYEYIKLIKEKQINITRLSWMDRVNNSIQRFFN